MTELNRDKLPGVVAHYLEDRKKATYDPAADFASDATVIDDGNTYNGLSEISNWVHTAEGEFTYTTTFQRAYTEGDRVTVVNRLEGNFPGGLVDLRYQFSLTTDGLIAELVIEV